VLIAHHNDSDGRLSAAVIRHWCILNDVKDDRYVELDYNKPFPLDLVEKDEDVFIVDFSLKPDVMKKLLEITENITWIDHHRTALDIKYPVELEGIRKDGDEAGCLLTWQYLFPDEDVPTVVQLVSDFDTWTFKDDDPVHFQYGLLSLDSDPTNDELWGNLFESDSLVDEIMEDGVVAKQFQESISETYCESYGFETELDDLKCFAVNLKIFGSFTFGNRMEEYDACLAFVFDGINWQVSIFSKETDVSEVAKKFKGGGHKNAAGWVCKELPFKRKENKNGS